MVSPQTSQMIYKPSSLVRVHLIKQILPFKFLLKHFPAEWKHPFQLLHSSGSSLLVTATGYCCTLHLLRSKKQKFKLKLLHEIAPGLSHSRAGGTFTLTHLCPALVPRPCLAAGGSCQAQSGPSRLASCMETGAARWGEPGTSLRPGCCSPSPPESGARGPAYTCS